jgi:glutamine amidotransferase-like uncharacterized protein
MGTLLDVCCDREERDMATIIQIVEQSGVYLGYLVGAMYVVVGVVFAAARIANSVGLVPEGAKGPIFEFLANFK